MRFSYALLSIALLNGCQITSHKDSTNKGSKNKIHQSVFYVNHTKNNSKLSLHAAMKQENVWDRIAMQLDFDVPNNERIKRYRNWYIKHPQHLRIVSQRAAPFLYLITERIEARNIPLEIALLPIVESSFDQFASSHVKAAGLWQFVPDTARRFGLEQNWWYDGRRDVVESTEAALDLLEYLHKKFDGNWLHALAAYNTGEARVFRAIRLNERKGKSTDFWSLNLPKETSSYVPKLIAVADVLKNRDKYGVTFEPISNKPAVKLVKPNVPMNLQLAAKYARVSLKELHKLNPAYNRFATSTKEMRQLLLPVENAKLFNINLARSNSIDRLVHKVRQGDALIKIAKDYNTSVTEIKRANRLTSNQIAIGQNLIIPSLSPSHEQNIQIAQSSSKRIDHTIMNGDSLWSIAKAYQISYADLANWNNINVNDTLQTGQKLVIFKPAEKSSFVYQIKLGDSLSTIAIRYNVTVTDLAKWNSLEQDSTIKPGQELTLYIDMNQA